MLPPAPVDNPAVEMEKDCTEEREEPTELAIVPVILPVGAKRAIAPPFPELADSENENDCTDERLFRKISLLVLKAIFPPFPELNLDNEADLKYEPLSKEILPLLVVKVMVPPYCELP